MFERELAETLSRIFGVKKISFDDPGPSEEQDCLFVGIESAPVSFNESTKTAKAMVTGELVIFGPNDKLTFGFFSKRIKQADPLDTRPFFFGTETNTRRYQNIVQRGISFVYFFSGQYDPERGTLSSVEFFEEQAP